MDSKMYYTAFTLHIQPKKINQKEQTNLGNSKPFSMSERNENNSSEINKFNLETFDDF